MGMKDECGACRKRLSKCKCSSTARSESIESILCDDDLFPDKNRRHLCVFVYHNYLRWNTSSEKEKFSAACIPTWEGWYAAWIRPVNNKPEIVTWSEAYALKCHLKYQDGSALTGYLGKDGRLIVEIPCGPTPNSHDYDPDRCVMNTFVQITQALTLEEICSGCRGVVHGTMGKPNNGRRVSHILREENGNCLMAKLPAVDNSNIDTVRIPTSKVQSYAPHLYDEARWRIRRRFTKEHAKKTQEYLHALFQAASDNDKAVRFALRRGWRAAVPSSDELLMKISGLLEKRLDIDSKKLTEDGKEPANASS